MTRLLLPALLLAARAAVPAAAQQSAPQLPPLSRAERDIARAVDARNAEGLALLERIVNINSGSMNLSGVREVGTVLRKELDALGFATRWVDGASVGRAGHLVAERTGRGPKLLLIGHLDTVFEPSSPFQRYEKLNDSTARGPGIIDMKGGDIIILQAMKALKDAGALDELTITIVFDGDEEHPGAPLAEARRALTDAARGAVAALGFEDGAADPKTAVISRRGTTSWTLTSTGTPAHSSQIFRADVGYGAIFEAARVLDGIRQRLAGQQYLTFNPGVVLGGTQVALDAPNNQGSASGKTNVVAARQLVQGDLRTLSAEQLAAAKQTMREVASASLAGTTSEITFEDGYPPLAPAEGNRRILATYDSVSRALGFGPVVGVDPMRAGAADVSFTAGIVPAAIDGLGLSGADDHTERETADLRQLPVLTKRAAVLIHRLGQASRAKNP